MQDGEPIGLKGEITTDTAKNTIVLHDGTTVGGFPFAKQILLDAKDYGAKGDGVTDDTEAVIALFRAANALPHDSVRIQFPPGTYRYSSGFDIQKASYIYGHEATLVYTGVGHAADIGEVGLSGPSTLVPFRIIGLKWAGGSKMTDGLYFRDYCVSPEIRDCVFYQFGNTTSYMLHFHSNNWNILFDGNHLISNDGIPRKGVWVEGRGDFGNSQLFAGRNQLQGSTNGVGIIVTGSGSILTNNKLDGYGPLIQVYACHSVTISNNYAEAHGAPGMVQFRGIVRQINVDGNYCNVHNTDAGTGFVALAPYDATSVVSGNFARNRISNADRPIIALNDIAQDGLYVFGNSYNGSPATRTQLCALSRYLRGVCASSAGGVSLFDGVSDASFRDGGFSINGSTPIEAVYSTLVSGAAIGTINAGSCVTWDVSLGGAKKGDFCVINTADGTAWRSFGQVVVEGEVVSDGNVKLYISNVAASGSVNVGTRDIRITTLRPAIPGGSTVK